MLVFMRFNAPTTSDPSAASTAGAEFDLSAVLAVLQERPGFLTGWIGRSPDDPEAYCLATLWLDVGSYRRSLSSFEFKIAIGPVQHLMLDQPSAFEVLAATDESVTSGSDRAQDAESSGPKRSES